MPLPSAFDAGVTAALSALDANSLKHVFFVACGGSLSIMYPAKFLLDQHAPLPSDVYNGAEFVARAPRSLDKNSLVILCSMTGTTKETTAAAEFARSRGATTIGLTVEPASPLGRAVDHVVGFDAPYTTGVPIDAKDSNYSRIYQIVMGLVALTGGENLTETLIGSLAALQPAIDRAHATFAPVFEDYAPRFAKEDVVYTVASGASYGAAYSFAICVLMEMQWINSQAIHANEFFHGPFEVLDKDRAFILMKGLDSTRPLEQRADEFLHRFGSAENILVLDAEKLDLSGIDPQFQGNVVPLIFFDTLWRFAYKIAELRNHEMLEARRYMKKITY
ncbi:SIS domain-containing protein [Phyllobacterium sp. 0TCS1.6C]|uniref:SIS domain-containing protein n=1 Tax=unclassified Phyllobacterium TaxID=2638441 RepID=UPI002264CAC0|nr:MULTISPECIES: SIS domain-containing protein [unclassified Phyllobacterium]MCX8282049.1 SIS domain-containing protein [Phyllobacterium sp. 0TCS1.6C]MCX8296259.1 SIS domain-containing protein [Phyllobacterium sp. 0TCS1.6A]